jgi:CheY-like chemotaxis protein
VSAKIATKSNLRRSWYDYNWDWALILLLAFVLLAGIVALWTYADHPQTAAAVDLLALSWGGLMTTVLVVEDEILVRLAICEDLAAEGYEVLTADNADQAIEILQSRNDITTIFTDIEMPGSMNGLKLAAAVRNRWPPVNIVITTGKARPPNDQMPTNSRFVAKPYQKADVLGALQSLGS